MRRPGLAIALLLALVPAHPGGAAPAGTLDRLVEALDLRLEPALAGRQLGRVDLVLALRQGAGTSVKLTDAVRELLLGRLNRRGARSVTTMAALGTFEQRRQRAAAAGHELLLDLELVVVEGYLHLRGLLVDTERSLWRDTLQPTRGALHHVHARVRVDAEVRSYQGSLGQGAVSFSPRAFGFSREPVLALGVGDLDGDGRNELVALEPARLQVLRFRGRSAGFNTLRHVSLAPPWSRIRSRRPVGALVVIDTDRDGRDELLLCTSEMEQGARLRQEKGELKRVDPVRGYPLAARRVGGKVEQLLGQTVVGQDIFDAAALSAGFSGVAPAVQKALPRVFYGLELATLSRRARQQSEYLGVVDENGELQIAVDGAPRAVVIKGVGVAFDLVDMDDDGAVEVVTTGDNDPGAGKDHILVHRLEPGGQAPRLLWRSGQLEGIVTALGHGDLDGDGKQELVAALLDEKGRSQLVVLN